MSDVPNLELETEPVEPVAIEPTQPIQPTVPAVDYEEKFANSTRETQVLIERNKVLEQALADRNQIKEPTEPEVRTAFPLWDSMTDTEKELARRTVRAERIGGNAAQEVQSIKAERSWNTSIELVLTSNNALQGKEQAFRQYASRPQYRGVPMEVLVNSFLQTQGTAPAPITTPKPGLETGNGGPRTPEKPKSLSTAELTALRTSDPKGYQAYLKTHEITLED